MEYIRIRAFLMKRLEIFVKFLLLLERVYATIEANLPATCLGEYCGGLGKRVFLEMAAMIQRYFSLCNGFLKKPSVLHTIL